MSEGQFTEADLAPSDEERAAIRAGVINRLAATVAVLAAGFWVGGLVALGACAAPFVFRLTPAPFSGDAMGAAFRRFDALAMGAAVLICGAEVVRTFLARRRRRSAAERIRGALAIVLAGAAAYGGLALTPRIMELHQAGARRGFGEDGDLLEAIHKRAELVGKLDTALAVVLVGLHVFTLRTRRPEDEDDQVGVAAPLPPGPRE